MNAKKFHLVKIQSGYRLCESFDAANVEVAKMQAIRLHTTKHEYAASHCPMVLRDGNTGERFCMRECADAVPEIPWYWWCSESHPRVVGAIDAALAKAQP
jgi:hypothetical protein